MTADEVNWTKVRGPITSISDAEESMTVLSELDGCLWRRWMGNDYTALGEAADKDWIDEGDWVEFYGDPAEDLIERNNPVAP